MKVICKKDFSRYNTKLHFSYFIKDNWYDCGDIYFSKVTKSKMVTISGVNDLTVSFSLYKDNYHYYFGEYFYTEKELRRLKINKLNNVST